MPAYKSLLHAFGVDLRRYPNRDIEITLNTLAQSRKIGLIVDVGANTGQFALGMRAVGYAGDIVSFEPMGDAFRALSKHAARDNRWSVRQAAVGAEATQMTINVAANSYSSSLLPMTQEHLAAAPESTTMGHEVVEVVRLDSQFDRNDGPLILKIDTQGFESQVLDGLGLLEDQVQVISLELSFVELYTGQMLFDELLQRIRSMGFLPWWFQPEFIDPTTRQMLQVNGVFVRS